MVVSPYGRRVPARRGRSDGLILADGDEHAVGVATKVRCGQATRTSCPAVSGTGSSCALTNATVQGTGVGMLSCYFRRDRNTDTGFSAERGSRQSTGLLFRAPYGPCLRRSCRGLKIKLHQNASGLLPPGQ